MIRDYHATMGDDDDELHEAVDKITDPERLLDGENPATTSRAEAVHWLWVYAELLGFKRNVVDETKSSAAVLPRAALPEADADLKLLDAERRRLQARYEFWSQRVADLS
jgi:hypothetical protein